MDTTNQKKKRKKSFMKKQSAVIATIVLLVGIILCSVQYFRFVSKTVYQESVSHLTEIFQQSNRSLTDCFK